LTFLSWEAFGELFTSFQQTALRLEVRERYDTDVEREPQRRFFAGEPDDLEWAQDWLAMVRKATSKGEVFRRVRVVSLPLSDYNRYALWFAQYTVGAGEDIRYLKRTQAGDLPDFDYWLFDSSQAVILHFDDEDRPVSAEVISDQATVEQLAAALEAGLSRAVSRDRFAEVHSLG
jgi:hypothetical protein